MRISICAIGRESLPFFLAQNEDPKRRYVQSALLLRGQTGVTSNFLFFWLYDFQLFEIH